MNDLKNLILEESVIKLTDGTVIKGSEAIAKEILCCCNAAMRGYNQVLVKAGVAGVVVGFSAYGLYKVGRNINETKKIKEIRRNIEIIDKLISKLNTFTNKEEK